MRGTQVFFSYVDDTKPFVDGFSQHFFSHELELQHLGRECRSGEVEREQLDKRIDIADIFIAFIGSTYGKDCAHELERRANLRKSRPVSQDRADHLGARPARSGGTNSSKQEALK